VVDDVLRQPLGPGLELGQLCLGERSQLRVATGLQQRPVVLDLPTDGLVAVVPGDGALQEADLPLHLGILLTLGDLVGVRRPFEEFLEMYRHRIQLGGYAWTKELGHGLGASALGERHAQRDRRGSGSLLIASGRLAAAGVALAELVHPSRRVDELLFAGEERVASIADVDTDLRLGAAGRELIATGAGDLAETVLGVNASFHRKTRRGL
jgi:hypothetical protein